MKISLTILILASIGFSSCGQIPKSSPDKVPNYVEFLDNITIDTNKIKTEDFSFDSYIHTEADYTDSTGKGIIIQNSYPRGGGLIYMTNDIQQYGHAVFWTRIINKTDKALELNVNFPADSFLIYPSLHTHFKLLVPQDIMTLDKVSVFSFGFDGVRTFVANNFYQPSRLQRTIQPNEETMFYVVLLSHVPTSERGISRTGFFLSGQDLVYKLTVDSSTSKLLPCGRIIFED